MKKLLSVLLLALLLLTAGCTQPSKDTDNNKTYGDNLGSLTDITPPASDDDLYKYIIKMWQAGKASELYAYASEELISQLDKDAFTLMFDSITDIGGRLLSYELVTKSKSNGIRIYSLKLDFENITVDLTLGIKDTKITAFVRNVFFDKGEFEIKRDGFTERHFLIESAGLKLNAVYTYVNDDKPHPAVLLISGSGPSDYNETVGLRTPFADIAAGLAAEGINSLRLDKRTLNYAQNFKTTDGIEEEYLTDCTAALHYLRSQSGVSGVSLLGHSLGGQIATELAVRDGNIKSMIIFNSSARSLADIAADQYSAADPANAATYAAQASSAKAATGKNAGKVYYFGANGYYWETLNKLDVIKNIKSAAIPTLIVNSTADKQIFPADYNLWNESLGGVAGVSIYLDSTISHHGYPDTEFLKPAAFSADIINRFTDFLLANK